MTATIPFSLARIGHAAFQGCGLFVVVVEPRAHDAGAVAGDAETDSEMEPLVECIAAANVGKIWAPDAVIARLAGPFKDFKCLADVPRGMRAAPDATTWPGVLLWQWWLRAQQIT